MIGRGASGQSEDWPLPESGPAPEAAATEEDGLGFDEAFFEEFFVA
jgi:hypothetical protein